jgi:hypothetical protein
MASTRAYWNNLKNIRDQIALSMGADVSQADKDTRAISNATLAAVSILAKTLTDKGVVTDAELLARANAALGADGSFWDDEPIHPPPPAV